MARWAISPIIGNGTETIDSLDPEATGPYRAKASDYGTHAAIIPGNADGSPAFNWALVKIGDEAVAAADADPSLTVFPALALDDVLTAGQRNWLITRLQHHGLPYGWVQPGITVRQALRTIGRYLEATFDVDWVNINV